MTDEQQQRREAIRTCAATFVETANALANAGVHPAVIIEGCLSAAVNLNRTALGDLAAVEWMRNAADHIESALLANMPTVRLQ